MTTKGAGIFFDTYLFVPLVVFVYFSLSKVKAVEIQHGFLVLASLYFYGYFNPAYLGIIVVSISVNYGLASMMKSEKISVPEKIILIMGILFNIGLLGYFKYYDFFVTNINQLFEADVVLKNMILPLGISFFTFQQFSFLLSVYHGKERVEGFIDYCVFVTFFPQLVAGPIVLYSEMIPQFRDQSRRRINWEEFAVGLYIFCMGLFKKIVIADTIALFVNNGFSASSLGFGAAWIVALSYTLQIYFDFSGYSDMAIGLGRIFNIHLPQNFNSPYRSVSITEFWKRWHMTLGRALSTYVYIPLGGNRKGVKRTCINLFLTFLVSGLWHGAAWTFVLWGVLHGVMVVIERLAMKGIQKIPRVIRRSGTFLYVTFLWVLFRAESFSKATMVYRGMFGMVRGSWGEIARLSVDGIVALPQKVAVLYIVGIVLIVFFLALFGKNTMERVEQFAFSSTDMAFTCVIFVLSTIHLSRLSTFIYFNF